MVSSAVIPLEPGENFRVIALPPGRYSWRGLYLGSYSSEFRGKLLFDLRADTADYVGDLDLTIDWAAKTYRLAISDRSRLAKARYESEFPVAAKSFPFATSMTEDKRVPQQ